VCRKLRVESRFRSLWFRKLRISQSSENKAILSPVKGDTQHIRLVPSPALERRDTDILSKENSFHCQKLVCSDDSSSATIDIEVRSSTTSTSINIALPTHSSSGDGKFSRKSLGIARFLSSLPTTLASLSPLGRCPRHAKEIRAHCRGRAIIESAVSVRRKRNSTLRDWRPEQFARY